MCVCIHDQSCPTFRTPWTIALTKNIQKNKQWTTFLTAEIWDAYRKVCKHTSWHTCIKWTRRVMVPRSRNTTGLALPKPSRALSRALSSQVTTSLASNTVGELCPLLNFIWLFMIGTCPTLLPACIYLPGLHVLFLRFILVAPWGYNSSILTNVWESVL